ncbi:hypothetical protein B0H11DRAFT_2253263 [Mycena galericulata]|nr:hypothetical protein B0H11DRAFT_2253263 [Mycena galericulata]
MPGKALSTDLRPFWGPALTRMVPSGTPKPYDWTLEDKLLAWSFYEAPRAKKIAWTLHDKLNIPKCLDSEECPTCTAYLTHVEDARARGGRRQTDRLRRTPSHVADDSEMEVCKTEEDDEDNDMEEDDNASAGSDMEEDDGERGEDMDLGDSEMDALFSLQDLIGKYRHLESLDPEKREAVEASVVAAMMAQVKAEAERGGAEVQQAALAARLDLLQLSADANERKLYQLTLDHGRVLAERDQARDALAEAEIRLADTLAALKQAEGKLHAAQIQLAAAPAHELAASSQAHATDARSSNRKRARVGDSTPVAGPSGDSTPVVLTPEEAEWLKFNEMARPGCDASPELIAQFLQYNRETTFKGIPLQGAAHTVDLRDVRGYRQVMGRAPLRARRVDDRIPFFQGVTRILQILGIPGKYARLLEEGNFVVATAEDLSPCTFGTSPAIISDAEVACLLAQRGLTSVAADDCWQFCRNYVDAQIAAPDKGVDIDAMRALCEEMKKLPCPPGLRPSSEDQSIGRLAAHVNRLRSEEKLEKTSSLCARFRVQGEAGFGRCVLGIESGSKSMAVPTDLEARKKTASLCARFRVHGDAGLGRCVLGIESGSLLYHLSTYLPLIKTSDPVATLLCPRNADLTSSPCIASVAVEATLLFQRYADLTRSPLYHFSTSTTRFKTWEPLAVEATLLFPRYADSTRLQPLHHLWTSATRLETSEATAVEAIWLFPRYADLTRLSFRLLSTPATRLKTSQPIAVEAILLFPRYADLTRSQRLHHLSTSVTRLKTSQPIAVEATLLFPRYADLTRSA